MFKLNTATVAIVLLVVVLQATVGLQIFRLGSVQSSINTSSVPLLLETQQFARLTTRVVGQTVLLENDLTRSELSQLRSDYDERKQLVDQALIRIRSGRLEEKVTSAFQGIKQNFTQINEELFSNQLEQRAQEEKIAQAKNALNVEVNDLADQLDQRLVRATQAALSPSRKASDGNTDLESYLTFAGEIEILNTLRSHALDITTMLEHSTIGQNIDLLDNNLHYRIRNFGQSLVLLEDTEDRKKLAVVSSRVKLLLSAEDGLISLLKRNSVTRSQFGELKQKQVAAIDEINQRTDEIVAAADDIFKTQIVVAAGLATTVVWIGITTTLLVLVGIFLVNKLVIRNQISRRFTVLTEDVVAISRGNYDHVIRIDGPDEIGTIAKALNVFKAQAGEIQRSNAELEKFAYVAAHDLRSPLDAIQDLARWTLEDERENLSEPCIENLELLIKRSSRLSALQSDLLTYAQIGEMDTSKEVINIANELAQMADLLDPNSRYNIKFVNDPGAITTFGLPLKQILLNLITNAIKHHDREEGQISVVYERCETVHRFTVEDDGPGIEPRFQAKIFELFKTLKSRDQVEGSGLGLALVSKVIERLDGILTVHSNAPDQRGCKFIFEIADLKNIPKSERIAA